jgi:ABC-type sugar transport system substrate-binding protein
MTEKPPQYIPEPGEIFEIDCGQFGQWQSMSRRSALVAGGCGALGMFLAACGSSSSGSSSSSSSSSSAGGGVGAGKTIALSLNGFNVYDQCLATGVLQSLAGTKYKFIGAQAAFDSSKEVANISNLLAKSPDALLIIPNTVESSSRGALQAQRAKVPVLNLLWSSPTPADSAYIGVVKVDGVAGGRLIAQYLGKTVKSGKILVVEGVPGQGFSEQITQGLKAGLAAYPGLTIAAMQPGLFSAGPAQTAVQNMLTAHPDAKAVVDYAAEMGNGISSYLKAHNVKNLVHVTSDGNEAMLPWLRQGVYLTAVRYYSSAQEGLIGGQIMRNYLEKKQKPSQFVTTLYQKMVTKDNLKGQPILCYDQFMSQVKSIA